MTSFLDFILGRDIPAVKAASGPGIVAMQTQPSLTTLFGKSPQDRMAAYLKAYKVGWFYKAESKISLDFAGLGIHVSPENTEGENEKEVIEPDLFAPWEALDPIGQFLRLMERPNPNQTGRQLRQKTQIRIDMAGAAFWYLESPSVPFGLPTGLYGISPARMWRSVDAQGNLVGWVMDRNDRGGGIPFTPEEILPFMAGSADDDGWGVGVVEAVYAQVPLSAAMANHTADILSTGGRLAGMMWPKERTLDEAEFTDAQRAWRSVTSDHNAAKRLLMFPEPMEWVNGSSTPAEIGIPELAVLNRDEILTAFPISPYQLGVPMPGGLNSAETRKEDRRDYWEGTIHPRVELFEEVVQTGLLSRYERAVGYTLDFEIEEPGLDDAAALIEKAGAFSALKGLGFDEKELVKAVGLDHIKFNGSPPPPDPLVPVVESGLTVVANDSSRQDATATQQKLGKAFKAEDLRERREREVAPIVGRGKSALSAFFDDQRRRVVAKVREMPRSKAARVKADPDAWWDVQQEDEALKATVRGLYVEVGRTALQVVADQVERFVRPDQSKPILADLLTYGADRVKDINDKTQAALRLELAEGTRRGYSLDQLIDGVPSEKYQGIGNVLLDNGAEAFGDLRAETIARTETALSYNRASLGGYKDFGIREVVAFDGDKDDECARRDGRTYPVDEAYGIADHPNGTLDWAPVVNFDKAVDLHAEFRDFAAKALDVAAIRQPPPVINIESAHPLPLPPMRTVIDRDPDTRRVTGTHQEPLDDPVGKAVSDLRYVLSDMPAPVINVGGPVINLPQPNPKRIERDEKGQVTRIVDDGS